MLADDLEVIENWSSKRIPEERFTDRAGRIRTLQIMKIPFIEPDLNEAAVLSVAIDITEQKQAKEEVARMRLFLKNIIDSMPSMLIGVDPWGYITVLNQPAEQAGGVSWEAAQGRFFGEVFPRLASQFVSAVGKPVRPSAAGDLSWPADQDLPDDAGDRRRTALRRYHGLSSHSE